MTTFTQEATIWKQWVKKQLTHEEEDCHTLNLFCKEATSVTQPQTLEHEVFLRRVQKKKKWQWWTMKMKHKTRIKMKSLREQNP